MPTTRTPVYDLTEAAAPYHVPFVPDPELYPFTSRWFQSSVGRVHYIDEGSGRPLLLMHGNPDWSFLYRKMIPLLAPHFRCIAMDYPGFGLSVHPAEYSYLPSRHAEIVAELVEHLDLQDAVLVGQDWGGPIGYDVASRMPERFTGLVAGNTMMWSARPFFLQRTFSQIIGLGFIQRLLERHHLFVKRIMPSLLASQLTAEEMRHYVDVAPSPHSRKGHPLFAKAIVGESQWLEHLEQRVRANLSDRPMLRIMGMNDVPLSTRAYLRKWDEVWPKAVKLDLPNAGHFWQEDEPEAVANAIISAYGSQTHDRNQQHERSKAMTNNTLLVTFAQPNAEQTETFHSYVGSSTQLAVDVGGEVSSRFAVRHLHGDAPASVFGFATFPSAPVINDMFEGPDYQKLVPSRQASVDSVNAYIVDEPELTALEDPTGDAVYLIVVGAPNPDATDDLVAYRQASGPIFANHGAEPVAQLPVTGHPIGDTRAGFISILTFPSADAVDAVFSDPAYLAVVDVRDRALPSLNLYVTVD